MENQEYNPQQPNNETPGIPGNSAPYVGGVPDTQQQAAPVAPVLPVTPQAPAANTWQSPAQASAPVTSAAAPQGGSPTPGTWNTSQPAAGGEMPKPYLGVTPSQWRQPNPPQPPISGTGGYNSGGQPPQGGGKRGHHGLAVVALVLACAVAGFGGSAVAIGAFNSNRQTVVYKVPEATGNEASEVNSAAQNLSVRDIAAKAGASVVSITTENLVTDQFFRGRVVSGAGSGVIISADGTIITNNHVVEGANNISVTLPDGSEHEATLVGTDEASDVAVIKIAVTGLTPAVLGNSDSLAIGDFCIAIGNPMGTLGGTVTDGIISSLNREITIGNNTMNLLQMSAAVSPGNSGGGLFNANGELIGLVNAKSSGQDAEGLGFAIPVNTAMKMAEDLVTNGYVTGRPGLGVTVINITTPEQAVEAQVSELGVYIAEVTPGGAASQAGLQAGDRIVSMDGKLISDYATLSTILKGKAVGDSMEMQVQRAGSLKTVTVVLQELSQKQKVTSDN